MSDFVRYGYNSHKKIQPYAQGFHPSLTGNSKAFKLKPPSESQIKQDGEIEYDETQMGVD